MTGDQASVDRAQACSRESLKQLFISLSDEDSSNLQPTQLSHDDFLTLWLTLTTQLPHLSLHDLLADTQHLLLTKSSLPQESFRELVLFPPPPSETGTVWSETETMSEVVHSHSTSTVSTPQKKGIFSSFSFSKIRKKKVSIDSQPSPSSSDSIRIVDPARSVPTFNLFRG
jgi:hypothetical protein